MMRIIGLGHYSRTGKDTFAKYLLASLKEYGVKSKRMPLAWKLKQICHDLYGWAGMREPEWYDTPEGEKDRDVVLEPLGMTPVEVWVAMGTDAVRENVYDRTWLDYLLKTDHGVDVLIVPDVRFPNEAGPFKEAGATLIKIVRPGYGPRNTTADRALIGYKGWDYVYGGTGRLAELEARASMLARWLAKGGEPPVQTAAERQAAESVEVLPDAA